MTGQDNKRFVLVLMVTGCLGQLQHSSVGVESDTSDWNDEETQAETEATTILRNVAFKKRTGTVDRLRAYQVNEMRHVEHAC